LSLWSPPPLKSNETLMSVNYNAGARALEAFVRPYPLFVPGTPTWIDFDLATLTFEAKFTQEFDYPGNQAFEAFVPSLHFKADSTEVTISGGTYHWDEKIQRIYWMPDTPKPLSKLGTGKVSAQIITHTIKLVSIISSPLTRDIEDDRAGICPTCCLM
jgi:Glycoside hydrolase family 5 C-terminal domain